MGQSVSACQYGQQHTPLAHESLSSLPSLQKLPGTDREFAMELCFAAAKGSMTTVQKMLERKGAHVNEVDYDERTALHVASAHGHFEVVELLIASKADVQATDSWGHTALDEAVKSGHEDIQAALRLAGAEGGNTPREHDVQKAQAIDDGIRMCKAAAAGSIPALRALLAARADVSASDYDGRTALHVAAAKGNLEAVLWLLDMSAHVDQCDNFGLTALSDATRNGHQEVASALVAKSPVNADMEFLRHSSDAGHWAIPSAEVELGRVLSKTIKSVIYIANWRGTKVVAKKTCDQDGLGADIGTTSCSSEDSVKLVARKEVLHEIHLLSSLRHPDLVMFLGACLDSSPPFFITEFMEGGDLERYYQAKARKLGHAFRPTWEAFVRWASAVARALGFLHQCSRPIIHRDLKPLNLLLTVAGDLKVTDFGISKLMAPKATMDIKPAPKMSGGVGTWRYMAPEVVRYQPYTDRVDIFSFALIMFFMVTGLEPFVEQFGRDAEVVLKEYLKGKEPRPVLTSPLVKCGPTIPQPLQQLMKDCWHETPASRPSATECTKRLAEMGSKKR